MPNFSSATVMGHMCRDVEMRQVGDHDLASFAVAVSRKVKGQETVSYFDCKAWNQQAGFINQYFKKGDAILVTGELMQETWEDKNGGGKRSKVVITVERAAFAGGGGRSGQRDYKTDDRDGGQRRAPAQNNRAPSGGGRYDAPDPDQNEGGGDVPF